MDNIYMLDPSAAGYNEFPNSPMKNAHRSWQKCFRDEEGNKLYFIDIYEYRLTFQGKEEVAFEAECQLYNKGNHAPMNLQLFSGWTIEDIEDRVRKIYELCGFEAYDERD